ncbi:hypothetical protein RIF29_19110 [Crotalaria pallida]|uniref:Uncharacterized protein n=1 Tax=Crotalaria pallida TaxID=3830 RepID=A0AAN9F071_CROPI
MGEGSQRVTLEEGEINRKFRMEHCAGDGIYTGDGYVEVREVVVDSGSVEVLDAMGEGGDGKKELAERFREKQRKNKKKKSRR